MDARIGDISGFDADAPGCAKCSRVSFLAPLRATRRIPMVFMAPDHVSSFFSTAPCTSMCNRPSLVSHVCRSPRKGLSHADSSGRLGRSLRCHFIPGMSFSLGVALMVACLVMMPVLGVPSAVGVQFLSPKQNSAPVTTWPRIARASSTTAGAQEKTELPSESRKPATATFLPDDRFDPSLSLLESLLSVAEGRTEETADGGLLLRAPNSSRRQSTPGSPAVIFPSTESSPPSPPPAAIGHEDLHLLLGHGTSVGVGGKRDLAQKPPKGISVPTDITPDLKAPEPCSRQKSKAFFRGQCVRLLQDGPPFCDVDEWLVLDEEATTEAMAVAKCAPKPCPSEDQPLLGLDGQCHNAEELQGSCTKGQVLTLDLFGRSLCDCNRHRVFWKDGNCYRVWRRGPCPQGQILVVEPTTSFISCQTNPCDQEGEALWKDGQCYELGQQGPCSDAEVFSVNEETLLVSCEGIDLRNLFYVPWKSCPAGSRRDFLGQCESGFSWGSSSNSGSSGKCQNGYIRNRNGACVPWSRWG